MIRGGGGSTSKKRPLYKWGIYWFLQSNYSRWHRPIARVSICQHQATPRKRPFRRRDKEITAQVARMIHSRPFVSKQSCILVLSQFFAQNGTRKCDSENLRKNTEKCRIKKHPKKQLRQTAKNKYEPDECTRFVVNVIAFNSLGSFLSHKEQLK